MRKGNAALAAMALLAASLGACVYNAPRDASPQDVLQPLATDRAAPQLALLDRVLTDYFTSDIANPPTICAGISDGGDIVALPPEQEVALIARHSTLAPFDRCRWNGEAYVDAVSGEIAMVFSLYSFECASDTQCSGWASYAIGPASAISAHYTMDYADGRWTFARERRLTAE